MTVPEPTSVPTASRDPRWRPAGGVNRSKVPPGSRTWLLDTGSLTERLAATGSGAFSVRRLTQRIERPLPSESRLLDLPRARRALVREVALCSGGIPRVFARSVLPLSSLTGPLCFLRQLGDESLGSLLFREPSLKRTGFELAELEGASPYIHPALHRPGAAWARRSRFLVRQRPLLVSEVFLPGFAA